MPANRSAASLFTEKATSWPKSRPAVAKVSPSPPPGAERGFWATPREAVSGPDYLLAIDQGTTSTRAILFDASGVMLHTARRELRQIYPRPGWVEHDPEEIWEAVVATCREAIAAAKGPPIAAIGITNQRETTMLWDRATGRPVHN